MGFAEELIKIRKLNNMTQESLALRCNVSRQAVAKWEKGEALPDVYLIAKIAKMFGVNIEELIWSKNEYIFENKQYYIKLLQESDKEDFCNIMREHRYMGRLLKLLDEKCDDTVADVMFFDTALNNEKTFVIRVKGTNKFVGYIYIESIDFNAPEMTMQFNSQMEFNINYFEMIRELLNWVNKEYSVRAIKTYVNSKVEEELYRYLGYNDIDEELILVLPV